MKSATNILIGITVMLTGCSHAQNSPSKTTQSNNTTEYNSTNQFIMQDSAKWNKLTPEEESVIVYKGTEAPNKGVYTDNHDEGRYFCRRCNAALQPPTYRDDSEFAYSM